MSGGSDGGREGDGGDDVKWLGEALRAVGVDEALRAVGAVRVVGAGFGHTLEAFKYFRTKGSQVKTMAETGPRAARWRSEGGDVEWVGKAL